MERKTECLYLVSAYSKYIPFEKQMYLRKIIEKASSESIDNLILTQLKDPLTVTLFSAFLGTIAVDRFYIGDKKKGFLKLLLFISYIILYTMSIVGLATNAPLFQISDVFWILPFIGVFAWWITDIFVVTNKVREENFRKLLEILK